MQIKLRDLLTSEQKGEGRKSPSPSPHLEFYHREDRLDFSQWNYYRQLFEQSCWVGVEIEIALPRGKKREEFFEQLINYFHPTGNYKFWGRYGIYQIVTEHCGIEFQLIGIKPSWVLQRDQFREIFSYLLEEGARTKGTCGIHFHFSVPSSKSIPELILANLWNLTRRYAPSLKYLASAGEKLNALCRRRNHNSHLELIRLNPLLQSMREIQTRLKNSNLVPMHQNFLNIEHIEFDSRGDIKTFHFEYRFLDADLSPTSVCAKVGLCYALLLRAVDLSQYGLVQEGSIERWKRQIELLDKLSNNDGTLAFSDTSLIGEGELKELREQSKELLTFLKPTLEGQGFLPAWRVLRFLVDNPISFLRSRGWEWKDIELVLERVAEREEQGELSSRLLKIIDLMELTGASSPEKWKEVASQWLFCNRYWLERQLKKIKEKRELLWDPKLGSYRFRS